jgi:hypothetical protein
MKHRLISWDSDNTAAASVFTLTTGYASDSSYRAPTERVQRTIDVALDHHEDKRVVTIDGVQRPSKQGSTQTALGLFHSDDTESEHVDFQPGFDFISPDAVFVLVWVQRDRGYRGIHMSISTRDCVRWVFLASDITMYVPTQPAMG